MGEGMGMESGKKLNKFVFLLLLWMFSNQAFAAGALNQAFAAGLLCRTSAAGVSEHALAVGFSGQVSAAGVSGKQGPACFAKDGEVYLIRSADELRQLALLVNENREVEPGVAAQTASYRLTADLDLTKYCENDGGWEPIGRKGHMDENEEYVEGGCFNGTFDGGNHVITGLYINRPDEQAQGLFGCREDLRPSGYPYMVDRSSDEFLEKVETEIKNLYIKDCDVTGSYGQGAVMGCLWNFFQEDYGEINLYNCHVTGKVTSYGTGGGVGGTVTSVKNSSFQGTVDSMGQAGGIAGEAYYIDGCYMRGNVSGSGNVGGIGGMAVCVRNCYSMGTVDGYNSVGGITGMGACITGCYTRTDVAGYVRTGGMIGEIQSMAVRVPEGASSAVRIRNCFMGGRKITRVEKTDKEIFQDTRDHNGYIYGFPGAGIDRGEGERVWLYRSDAKAEGFDSGFYEYLCTPVDWTWCDRERWEEILLSEDARWEDIWAETADNTYPRLKWEEENLFAHTVTVMVREGDSLSLLAMRLLGDGDRWGEIYERNRAVIGEDADLIAPGTELEVEVRK